MKTIKNGASNLTMALMCVLLISIGIIIGRDLSRGIIVEKEIEVRFVQPIHLTGAWQDDKNGDGTISFVWWPDWYEDEMTLMEMNVDNITFGRVKNTDTFWWDEYYSNIIVQQ